MTTYQFPPVDNPKQFEHLLMDLLNEHYYTLSFKCFGKNGHNQKGIDVFSAEKQIIVQCKHKDLTRRPISIKRELLTDIESTVLILKSNATAINFDTLVIATTASEHTDYDEFGATLQMEHNLPFKILFWGWETIQQKLSHLPAVLAKYYPQFGTARVRREEKVVSRLNMKKNIQRDFALWLDYRPEDRQRRSRMIIHSIDDRHYPEHVNEHGPWYWLAAEIDRLSTKGLGFVDGLADLYVNKDLKWTDRQPVDTSGFKMVSCARISIIAFEDIVGYDLKGDEYYTCPHFYVRFNEHNSPFSEFYYKRLDSRDWDIPLILDQSSKLMNGKET